MKKLVKILMPLLSCLIFFYPQGSKAHSSTFFVPRSITTDSVFELSLSNYHRYHDDNESRAQFYIKPFVMQSTNKKSLARYFLPNNAQCITLDESGQGNVDPLWFSLISPAGSSYSSNVFLAPVRTAAGGIFTFYMFLNDCWWFGLNTTVMHAKNDLKVCECRRSKSGTCPGIANACQAFNNPTWCAGKLPCCAQGKTGLDDIQLKIGYDFMRCDDNHASIYVVGTIPTSRKQKSKVLFEPLVGSNQGSLGIGFDGDYRISTCDTHNLSVMADLKYRYVFSATERRSFDLCKNGDWSRYLLVVTQTAPAFSLPGINLLTLPVKVKPGSTIDFWLALHYQRCALNVEIGYDLWWRQAEKICKKCCIPETFGIQTLALCTPPITSASTANISQAATGSNATVSDAVFTPITNADINLNSAAHPHAISNTLYIDVGYTYDQNDCRSWLVGLGSSYEFANKNALAQWAIWATGGVAF